MGAWLRLGLALLTLLGAPSSADAAVPQIFRAGASMVDITPTNFPVIINGGFLAGTATAVHDPLHVRCLVLDDGTTRVGLGVIDTCMIPRELADGAKALIQEATGLRSDRLLLAATHTHYAPSLMQTLGTPPDPHYPAFLLPRLVEGFRQAVNQLTPARVGWAVTPVPEHTHNRVWIRRPDRINPNPFGERTVRADMHPGYQNPDTLGPSGPVDADLTVIALQTLEGRPLAMLANYAMHYHGGAAAVSADYFGAFARKVQRLLAPENPDPSFVGIMSQGCAGDLHWMDYSQPARSVGLDEYAEALAQRAWATWRQIRFQDWVPLAMRDLDLALPVRRPDPARLAWARGVAESMQDRLPQTQAEVYAREQLWLDANPVRSTKLQALRLGELGFTAFSGEVFALTSLKLKAQSPLPTLVNLELANGGDGYIPPPEHHPLGSYNTWACRTAGLAVDAEPKVVNALLSLLEEVSGRPRQPIVDPHGDYAQFILKAEPLAYWRLNDFGGPTAREATRNQVPARYETGVAFYLEGPDAPAFSGGATVNRAPHLAGGRLRTSLSRPGSQSSVEGWFWNALSPALRGVTGILWDWGDQLAIEGTNGIPGRLVLSNGAGGPMLAGTAVLPVKQWTHVVVTRDGPRVVVYVNGAPEILGELPPAPRADLPTLVVGGGVDARDSFEGKIDEVAAYDRALGAAEVLRHVQLAGLTVTGAKLSQVDPDPMGSFSLAVLQTQPQAYWRLGENGFGGLKAVDATPNAGHALYEAAVELYGLGPRLPGLGRGSATNHAPRFAGGRLRATVAPLGPTYSVTFWFKNRRPNDTSPVTGYLFSRGPDGADGAPGDHLGIGGTHQEHLGRLLFYNGNALGEVLVGREVIQPGAWYHAVLVRDGTQVRVYLNGQAEPEITGDAQVSPGAAVNHLFFGGRNDSFANLDGWIDEVAVYGRALTAAEASSLFRSAQDPGSLGERADGATP